MAALHTLAPTTARIHTEADHRALVKLIDLSAAGTEFNWHTFELRWLRWDSSEPEVKGVETLTLSLDQPVDGKAYSFPGPEAEALYSMATPSKGQGARAVALEGTVRVVKRTSSGALLAIDLAARMARIDVRGEFREAVRGTWWVAARADE